MTRIFIMSSLLFFGVMSLGYATCTQNTCPAAPLGFHVAHFAQNSSTPKELSDHHMLATNGCGQPSKWDPRPCD